MSNNPSTSPLSRGCESGWTLYLDDENNGSSFSAAQKWQRGHGRGGGGRRGDAQEEQAEVEEEEENLSMVSDASSGPPFVEVDEDSCNDNECHYFGSTSRGGKNNKKKKDKMKEYTRGDQHLHYQDTASSFPLNKGNYSLSYDQASIDNNDAAKFQGKSEFHKHHSSMHSSVAEKATSEKKGVLRGRKWL